MELPRLKPLYEKYRDQGLEIVVIDRQNDTENALKFIEEYDLPYHFFENGEGGEEVVRNLFGVRVFPTSFLIDENGKVMYMHIGFDEGDEEKFEKEIVSLLGD